MVARTCCDQSQKARAALTDGPEYSFYTWQMSCIYCSGQDEPVKGHPEGRELLNIAEGRDVF